MRYGLFCRTVLSLLLIFSTIGAFGQGKFKGKTIRLVTYNVGTFSKETQDSSPKIADLLKMFDAQTVGFNEVDSCNRRHDANQLAKIAALMGKGWKAHYASAMDWNGGAYGNGIITSANIIGCGKVILPKFDGYEQRSCAYIETDDYVFASLHLDYKSSEVGVEQLKVATDGLIGLFGRIGKPVFLSGDFNAAPDGAVLREAGKDWVVLTSPDLSYPANNPKVCIDYIMLLRGSGPVEVLQGGTLPIENAYLLSDHLPVFLVVRI